MFPNDDICSPEAARLAARRLFQRFGEGPRLGTAEVTRLIQATYAAIDLPFDPDEHDASSFIRVFDRKEEGSIRLGDLEEMAVRYLCGEEALESKVQVSTMRSSMDSGPTEPLLPPQTSSKETRSKLELLAETNNQLLLNPPPSPKPRPSPTQKCTLKPFAHRYHAKLVPTYTEPSREGDPRERMKEEGQQIGTGDEGAEEVLQKGRVVFDRYCDHPLGISEAAAAQALAETYQLFGRKGFSPTRDDVRVWLRLCDRNRDGVVDWEDFRYFLQRSHERNRPSSTH